MSRGLGPGLVLILCGLVALHGCGGTPAPYLSPVQSTAQELNRKGVESVERGDGGRALEQFGEALRLSASIEYLDGSVASLINLARLHRRAGRLAEAAAHGERAALLAGNGARAGEAAFERALTALAQGALAPALEQARRAAAEPHLAAAERGARLNLQARIERALGASAAAATAGEALALNRAAEQLAEEANSERLLAELAFDAGRLAAAEAGFLRALALDKRCGLSTRIAADLRALARCAARRGAGDEERHYLQRAAAVSLNGRDHAAAKSDLARLAELYRAAGDAERAAALEREGAALGSGGVPPDAAPR